MVVAVKSDPITTIIPARSSSSRNNDNNGRSGDEPVLEVKQKTSSRHEKRTKRDYYRHSGDDKQPPIEYVYTYSEETPTAKAGNEKKATTDLVSVNGASNIECTVGADGNLVVKIRGKPDSVPFDVDNLPVKLPDGWQLKEIQTNQRSRKTERSRKTKIKDEVLQEDEKAVIVYNEHTVAARNGYGTAETEESNYGHADEEEYIQGERNGVKYVQKKQHKYEQGPAGLTSKMEESRSEEGIDFDHPNSKQRSSRNLHSLLEKTETERRKFSKQSVTDEKVTETHTSNVMYFDGNSAVSSAGGGGAGGAGRREENLRRDDRTHLTRNQYGGRGRQDQQQQQQHQHQEHNIIIESPEETPYNSLDRRHHPHNHQHINEDVETINIDERYRYLNSPGDANYDFSNYSTLNNRSEKDVTHTEKDLYREDLYTPDQRNNHFDETNITDNYRYNNISRNDSRNTNFIDLPNGHSNNYRYTPHPEKVETHSSSDYRSSNGQVVVDRAQPQQTSSYSELRRTDRTEDLRGTTIHRSNVNPEKSALRSNTPTPNTMVGIPVGSPSPPPQQQERRGNKEVTIDDRYRVIGRSDERPSTTTTTTNVQHHQNITDQQTEQHANFPAAAAAVKPEDAAHQRQTESHFTQHVEEKDKHRSFSRLTEASSIGERIVPIGIDGGGGDSRRSSRLSSVDLSEIKQVDHLDNRVLKDRGNLVQNGQMGQRRPPSRNPVKYHFGEENGPDDVLSSSDTTMPTHDATGTPFQQQQQQRGHYVDGRNGQYQTSTTTTKQQQRTVRDERVLINYTDASSKPDWVQNIDQHFSGRSGTHNIHYAREDITSPTPRIEEIVTVPSGSTVITVNGEHEPVHGIVTEPGDRPLLPFVPVERDVLHQSEKGKKYGFSRVTESKGYNQSAKEKVQYQERTENSRQIAVSYSMPGKGKETREYTWDGVHEQPEEKITFQEDREQHLSLNHVGRGPSRTTTTDRRQTSDRNEKIVFEETREPPKREVSVKLTLDTDQRRESSSSSKHPIQTNTFNFEEEINHERSANFVLGVDQGLQRPQSIHEKKETHRSAHQERKELYDVRTQEVHDIVYTEPPKVTFQEEREVKKDVSFTLGLEDYDTAQPFEPLPVEKIRFEETREIMSDHDVAVVFGLDEPIPQRPQLIREDVKTVETFEQMTILDTSVVVTAPPELPPHAELIAATDITPPAPRKVSISAAIESAAIHHNEIDMAKPIDKKGIFETSIDLEAKERHERAEQKLELEKPPPAPLPPTSGRIEKHIHLEKIIPEPTGEHLPDALGTYGFVYTATLEPKRPELEPTIEFHVVESTPQPKEQIEERVETLQWYVKEGKAPPAVPDDETIETVTEVRAATPPKHHHADLTASAKITPPTRVAASAEIVPPPRKPKVVEPTQLKAVAEIVPPPSKPTRKSPEKQVSELLRKPGVSADATHHSELNFATPEEEEQWKTSLERHALPSRQRAEQKLQLERKEEPMSKAPKTSGRIPKKLWSEKIDTEATGQLGPKALGTYGFLYTATLNPQTVVRGKPLEVDDWQIAQVSGSVDLDVQQVLLAAFSDIEPSLTPKQQHQLLIASVEIFPPLTEKQQKQLLHALSTISPALTVEQQRQLLTGCEIIPALTNKQQQQLMTASAQIIPGLSPKQEKQLFYASLQVDPPLTPDQQQQLLFAVSEIFPPASGPKIRRRTLEEIEEMTRSVEEEEEEERLFTYEMREPETVGRINRRGEWEKTTTDTKESEFHSRREQFESSSHHHHQSTEGSSANKTGERHIGHGNYPRDKQVSLTNQQRKYQAEQTTYLDEEEQDLEVSAISMNVKPRVKSQLLMAPSPPARSLSPAYGAGFQYSASPNRGSPPITEYSGFMYEAPVDGHGSPMAAEMGTYGFTYKATLDGSEPYRKLAESNLGELEIYTRSQPKSMSATPPHRSPWSTPPVTPTPVLASATPPPRNHTPLLSGKELTDSSKDSMWKKQGKSSTQHHVSAMGRTWYETDIVAPEKGEFRSMEMTFPVEKTHRQEVRGHVYSPEEEVHERITERTITRRHQEELNYEEQALKRIAANASNWLEKEKKAPSRDYTDRTTTTTQRNSQQRDSSWSERQSKLPNTPPAPPAPPMRDSSRERSLSRDRDRSRSREDLERKAAEVVKRASEMVKTVEQYDSTSAHQERYEKESRQGYGDRGPPPSRSRDKSMDRSSRDEIDRKTSAVVNRVQEMTAMYNTNQPVTPKKRDIEAEERVKREREEVERRTSSVVKRIQEMEDDQRNTIREAPFKCNYPPEPQQVVPKLGLQPERVLETTYRKTQHREVHFEDETTLDIPENFPKTDSKKEPDWIRLAEERKRRQEPQQQYFRPDKYAKKDTPSRQLEVFPEEDPLDAALDRIVDRKKSSMKDSPDSSPSSLRKWGNVGTLSSSTVQLASTKGDGGLNKGYRRHTTETKEVIEESRFHSEDDMLEALESGDSNLISTMSQSLPSLAHIKKMETVAFGSRDSHDGISLEELRRTSTKLKRTDGAEEEIRDVSFARRGDTISPETKRTKRTVVRKLVDGQWKEVAVREEDIPMDGDLLTAIEQPAERILAEMKNKEDDEWSLSDAVIEETTTTRTIRRVEEEEEDIISLAGIE